MATRRRFQAGVIDAMGLEPGVLDRPGTTIVPSDDPAGTQLALLYSVGAHSMLWCDPAVKEILSPLASDERSMTDDEFRSWATSVGGEIVGNAVMKTQWEPRPDLGPSPGAIHRFDWSSKVDLQLIQRLVDASSQGDLEEAELAMDGLDAMAIGLLDNGGDVAAYGSSRPFVYGTGFGDIGVLVRAGIRSGGWGRAVVAALIDRVLLPGDLEPLYRCDPTNVGSDRLSASLGFQPAVALSVVQFPSG